MNRGYTRESYLELISRARARIPNLSIVGDMIVGFPTETDAEFQESLTLLDEVMFKQVYVFKYSPRPGTVSGKRDPDDITTQVKKERNNMMLRHQQKISLAQHQALLGQTFYVLVERVAKNQGLDGASKNSPYPEEDQTEGSQGGLVQIGGIQPKLVKSVTSDAAPQKIRLSARTRGDHIVIFEGSESDIGQIVPVKITEARALSTSGVRV